MPTWEDRAVALAGHIAADVKALEALIAAADGRMGDLATLATTDKSSLIAALNEVAATSGAGQDAAQVQAAVDALEAKLLDGVAVDFDTLKEIADFSAQNEGLITTLAARVTAVETDVATLRTDVDALEPRVTAVEGVAAANAAAHAALVAAIGDPDRDLVADYDAVRNA